MAHIRIKTGDMVEVVTGKDRGTRAKVIRVLRAEDKVIVEGVNTAKRHQKARMRGESGQVLDIDMPIHISNVMLYDESAKKRTRVGVKVSAGSRVRISKQTGNQI